MGQSEAAASDRSYGVSQRRQQCTGRQSCLCCVACPDPCKLAFCSLQGQWKAVENAILSSELGVIQLVKLPVQLAFIYRWNVLDGHIGFFPLVAKHLGLALFCAIHSNKQKEKELQPLLLWGVREKYPLNSSETFPKPHRDRGWDSCWQKVWSLRGREESKQNFMRIVLVKTQWHNGWGKNCVSVSDIGLLMTAVPWFSHESLHVSDTFIYILTSSSGML